jgi:hypothetical protein
MSVEIPKGRRPPLSMFNTIESINFAVWNQNGEGDNRCIRSGTTQQQMLATVVYIVVGLELHIVRYVRLMLHLRLLIDNFDIQLLWGDVTLIDIKRDSSNIIGGGEEHTSCFVN